MHTIANRMMVTRLTQRWAAVVFALALALGAAGCAGDEEPEPAADKGSTQVATPAVEVDTATPAVVEKPAPPPVEETAPDTSAPEMPPHPRLEPEYGFYTVQIGSYDSRESAQPFMDKLSAEGLDPYLIDEVIDVDGQEKLVYRLRFGKYETKDEAHNRGSEVALRYRLDYWVDNYKR